ncbi:MAG TPA: hypothetical protein VE961_21155 [Pyrinomonadaceae bacterium]|nr:hypothetical protein [Pyrinomonadaceae bacterium]
MLKKTSVALGILVSLGIVVVCAGAYGLHRAAAAAEGEVNLSPAEIVATENGFSVEVLVYGSPATEYAARGRRYVEALENAEYELRIRNPTASRVAVAVAVDGLNSIDARHTSAWDAHKWVIEPYGTITVRGWQMSSESARRFYFTTERDSYGAKLGQTANLGVISAVFFRERGQPVTVTQRTRPDSGAEDAKRAPRDSRGESLPTQAGAGNADKERSVQPYPSVDDDSAATGIGRSVRNDVQWVHMDLDAKAVAEVTIRYEYRASLVKLGIIPRDYPRPDVLDRRERAKGFEPKFCPQP